MVLVESISTSTMSRTGASEIAEHPVVRNNRTGIGRYVPSDEREAPDSLKSSDPICMGNTRSWGRILGILEMSCGAEGGRWKVSRPFGVSLCLAELIADKLGKGDRVGIVVVYPDSGSCL
jgi:hypothetical protein